MTTIFMDACKYTDMQKEYVLCNKFLASCILTIESYIIASNNR